MDYSQIYQKLKNSLDPPRFTHTLGVEEMAIRLAEKYGANIEQARIAALLHDCAKPLSRFHLLRRLRSSDIVVDETEESIEALLHAPVGAIIANEDFGITDQTILSAIRHHTIGSPEMNLLDKIIFLADYIEPARDCPGIDQVREKAFQDLDQALVLASGRTIIYEIKRNNQIHLNTVKMRNSLIRKGEQDE